MASSVKFSCSMLLVIAVIACVQACTPTWKDCGSVKGKVSDVVFRGPCDGHMPELKKGQVVGLNISFTANEDSAVLKTSVHGIIAGVPVPFPVPDPDACTGCGVTCPVKSGTQYDYSESIPVKSEYPSIELTVKWELQDANGADVVCIVMPAKIC